MALAATETHAPHTERLLLPKEHGASIELAFPLAGALLGASLEPSVLAYAAAAILAFVAHEPFLVLAGHRGARALAADGARAKRWLAGTATCAGALGTMALALFEPAARLAALVPTTVAALALFASLRGVRERSLAMELAVALALTSVPLPLALHAGVALTTALETSGLWWLAFALGTAAARGALYRRKDDGRLLRVAGAIGGVVLVGSAALAILLPASWAAALAPAPFAAAAVGLAAKPPPPGRMAAVGLALVGASCLTLLCLHLRD